MHVQTPLDQRPPAGGPVTPPPAKSGLGTPAPTLTAPATAPPAPPGTAAPTLTALVVAPVTLPGTAATDTSTPRIPTPCRLDVVVPGALLSLTGRLDVAAAADVRLALAAALAAGTGELLLDVAGLTTLDATGLGVLVGGHRRAQREGRVLVLRDVPPAVARLLFVTRLDKVLRLSRSAPST